MPAEEVVSTPNIVLRMGSQGPAVTKLQRYLNQLGVQVAADGVFGMDTRTAVLAVQQRLRVSSDGIVGPATWAAISGALQASLDITPADVAATGTSGGIVPSPAPGGGAPVVAPPASSGGLLGWFRGLAPSMKWGVALLAAGGVWALLPEKKPVRRRR